MNRRITLITLAAIFCLGAKMSSGSDALSFRGGESIHRLSLIEPLGAGGFSADMRAQFLQLKVDTSSFDMRFGFAYGLLPGLDFSFYMPYMRMVNGADNKFGVGDGIITMKYVRGWPQKRVFKWGFQTSFLIPTGYDKNLIGFPAFTQSEFGYGGRWLAELQGGSMTLAGNIGGFWTEKGTVRNFFMGLGGRLNLMGRLLMLNGEITTCQGMSTGKVESYAFTGVESQLPYIGLGLRLGLESKMKDDRPLRLVIGASLTSRKSIPGISRGILESKRRYQKLMVFEFLDEDEGFTGSDVKDKLCRNLGSLEQVTILDPSPELPDDAYRDRESALAATKKDSPDLLVFAQYYDYGMERNHGFVIPYFLGFHKTRAHVTADLWVIDTESSEQIYKGRFTGKASKLRGVTLFPASKTSENIYLPTPQTEKIRRKAVDDLIKEMSVVFSDKLKK